MVPKRELDADKSSFLHEVLEADEQNDRDRAKDLAKEKLTMTECILGIVISLVFVSLLAVFLVEEIEYLVHDLHVPDNVRITALIM
jgi:Ca2+:H+ antiporter